MLFRDLQLGFFDFINQVLKACDVNPSLAKIPVRFNNPVYGTQSPNFTDFAAPGVILTIIFFLSVALTSGAMLIERNEGMLERCLVMGITGIELLFSHVATQFVIMCGQTTFVLIFSFSIFGLTLEGEILWVILLTILTGLCGMCFGKCFFAIFIIQNVSKHYRVLEQGSSCHQPAIMSVQQRTWRWAVFYQSLCCAVSFGRSKECIRD